MRLAAAIPALVAAAATVLTAQQQSMRTVMERASQYVSQFESQLGGIVAEEDYSQEVIPPGTFNSAVTQNSAISGRGAQMASVRTYRDLRSDLLLIYPIGAGRWVQFRDVFEVDGTSVHDRNDRLANLFLKPSPSTAAQVRRIQDESSRYNIGALERTVNVPVLPLIFLNPALQSRFTFTRELDLRESAQFAVPREVPSGANFAVPPGTMEIRYQETAPSTLIRTTANRDLPVRGRFWINPDTGSVLLTEIIFEDPFVTGTVHVAYKLDDELGFMVPVEMREHYFLRSTEMQINGTARYLKFRKFQVRVDEQLAPMVPPATPTP